MTVVTVILRVLSTQYGLLIGSVRGGTYNLLDPASWPPVNAHKIEGTEAHAHPSRAIRAYTVARLFYGCCCSYIPPVRRCRDR